VEPVPGFLSDLSGVLLPTMHVWGGPGAACSPSQPHSAKCLAPLLCQLTTSPLCQLTSPPLRELTLCRNRAQGSSIRAISAPCPLRARQRHALGRQILHYAVRTNTCAHMHAHPHIDTHTRTHVHALTHLHARTLSPVPCSLPLRCMLARRPVLAVGAAAGRCAQAGSGVRCVRVASGGAGCRCSSSCD